MGNAGKNASLLVCVCVYERARAQDDERYTANSIKVCLF